MYHEKINRERNMAFVTVWSTPRVVLGVGMDGAGRCAMTVGDERRARSGARPGRAAVLAAAAATAAAVVMGGTISNVEAVGLEKGRLEKCRGDVPCISTTSVGNPSKFGPPWSYRPQTDDADTAWQALKVAVGANVDGGTIVEVSDGPKEYYLHAEFPSTWRGIDDVEFRLVKGDALVTYRSASREAIFIYPLQTPINTNKNKNRLEEIRRSLGWEEFAGEELYERSK